MAGILLVVTAAPLHRGRACGTGGSESALSQYFGIFLPEDMGVFES